MDLQSEAHRVMAVALGKMYSGRFQRGGSRLHRSLLLSLVLRGARDVYLSVRSRSRELEAAAGESPRSECQAGRGPGREDGGAGETGASLREVGGIVSLGYNVAKCSRSRRRDSPRHNGSEPGGHNVAICGDNVSDCISGCPRGSRPEEEEEETDSNPDRTRLSPGGESTAGPRGRGLPVGGEGGGGGGARKRKESGDGKEADGLGFLPHKRPRLEGGERGQDPHPHPHTHTLPLRALASGLPALLGGPQRDCADKTLSNKLGLWVRAIVAY